MKVVTSPQRWVCLVLGLVGLVAVSACSSSGDGGGGGTPTVAAPVQGVFVDSPVQGLGYLTQPSGLSGVTNANGQFNYNPGDTVTFNLFGRTIGSAVPATPVVTALSVFGATSITDPRVLNLSQLLLTLGGIPAGSNPIVIPTTPPAGFPATLDFSAANFDTLFPGLVSEAVATTHLQANFSTLSVILAGGGASGGTVTSSSMGINCGAVCSADFFRGTAVSLTATGAGFTGWSGACTGTGACVVTLNAAASVTATFASAPVTATVTVTKAGSGSGTVTSSPVGINCGATCSASLVQGTVDLTAAALPGSTFAGWSNGTGNASCTGTGTCSIPLTVDSGIIATFTVNAVPVSVTANIASGNGGGGSVQCSADGGAAGPCGSYLPGAAIVMTATPNAISNFTGWSGAGCSGTGTCNFTLAADTTVTANFNRPTLTVQVNGIGSVSSNPTGINACTTNCTAPFDKGAPVTLTSGTGLTGWNGGGCTGTSTCVVTLGQNTTVTANFGAVWQEEAYLKVATPTANERFGSSVGISGDTAVVGKPLSPVPGVSNEVNLFKRNSSTGQWARFAVLRPSSLLPFPDGLFGSSLAIEGNTLAIPGLPFNGILLGSAGVNLFTKDSSGQWNFDTYVPTSIAGGNVTLQGDVLAVSNLGGSGGGSVEVFTKNVSGGWGGATILRASNVDPFDNFGWSLSASGNTIVVGAVGEDSNGTSPGDNSVSGAGAVYVFTRDSATGAWPQTAYLKAPSPSVSGDFGHGVSISGDMLAVGTPGFSLVSPGVTYLGAVYLFSRNPSTGVWTQTTELKVPDASGFGWRVSLKGNTLVVGAIGGRTPATTGVARVYVFKSDATGTWVQDIVFTASTAEVNDTAPTGITLDFDGTSIVTGAQGEDGNGSAPSDNSIQGSGAAYIFRAQ